MIPAKATTGCWTPQPRMSSSVAPPVNCVVVPLPHPDLASLHSNDRMLPPCCHSDIHSSVICSTRNMPLPHPHRPPFSPRCTTVTAIHMDLVSLPRLPYNRDQICHCHWAFHKTSTSAWTVCWGTVRCRQIWPALIHHQIPLNCINGSNISTNCCNTMLPRHICNSTARLWIRRHPINPISHQHHHSSPSRHFLNQSHRDTAESLTNMYKLICICLLVQFDSYRRLIQG